jgi:hypothetical protein
MFGEVCDDRVLAACTAWRCAGADASDAFNRVIRAESLTKSLSA